MKRITNRHKRNAMLPPPEDAPKEMTETDRLHEKLGEWHRVFFRGEVPPDIARRMVEDRARAEASNDTDARHPASRAAVEALGRAIDRADNDTARYDDIAEIPADLWSDVVAALARVRGET